MPLLVGNKIYCHMPKTGGAWLGNYIQKAHGATFLPGHGHSPAIDIPPQHLEGRQLFGTVRDPWSWYASWWMHAYGIKKLHEDLKPYGRGLVRFRDVLIGAATPDPKRTPRNIAVIWNLPDKEAHREKFLKTGAGLYTWVFRYIYGDGGGDMLVRTLIDTPTLYEGLGEVLGATIDPKEHPPSNTRAARPKSAIEDVSDFYDGRLIERVWEMDRKTIELLGYNEPFGRAPSPVIRL